MFKYFAEILFVIVGACVIVSNILFFSSIELLFSMLNLVGALIAVLPSLLLFYKRFRERKQMEEQFMIFIGDLNEGIDSGMTLPRALEHSSKKDYLALNPAVQALAAQVDWGIPFQKAFLVFGKKTNSLRIRRAVETIVQTYKAGGKIGDTLRSIAESLIALDKIQKERSASVHSQIITSYIIYFVFIMILVILQVFLIPSLIPSSSDSLLSVANTAPLQQIFSSSFVNFILIQGFFAGLVTGKMSEGSVIAGVKHSVLLMTIGYTIFSFASQLEIKFL